MFRDYVQHIADRRFERIGLKAIYRSKNPFPWMSETIDLGKEKNFGFNAQTDTVEDLIQSQVIDPAKVVKNCLKYAASVAGIILISEVLIADAQEDEEEIA